MITLNMQNKAAPVSIGISHFSTESNILNLEIKLMDGATEYDLTGKTVTATFQGKPPVGPLSVVAGVIQLPITNDLISVGANKLQLAINWATDNQALSPIMLWNILTPIVPGLDPGSVDLLSALISDCIEINADEALRVTAENARAGAFNALVIEYNALKADLIQQIADGTASVDALELLEADYAAKASTLETTYAPRLTAVESDLAENAIEIGSDVKFKDYNDAPIVSFVSDDGRAADYSVMFPIFVAAGVPFTTAVVTSFMGNVADYCTIPQLTEMKNQGMEVCSHTNTHPNLSTITDVQLDDELKISQEWLRQRGFSHKVLCVPYNGFGERELKYISKYYDCARTSNVGRGYNVNPIASYNLRSKFIAPSSTLAEFQALIDNAVANNGWLIISTHSWEIDSWGMSTFLADLVAYAKSKCDVVTLGEGMARRGNVVNSGATYVSEISEKHKEHFYVAKNGKVSSNYITSKWLQPNSVNGNTHIDSFEENVCSICYILQNQLGVPDAQPGYLYTYKYMLSATTENGYYYQIFKTYNTTKQYIRKCNNDKTWGAWERILTDADKFTHLVNGLTNATPLSDFAKGITVTEVPNSTSTGMPNGKGGLLTTFRSLSVEDFYYDYQTYVPNNTTSIFVRKSTGLGTWGAWEDQKPVNTAPLNTYNGLTPLSSFPVNKVTHNVINTASADAGLPVQIAGVLSTYYLNTDYGYCFQKYKKYGSNDEWIRYATSLTAWSAWSKYSFAP